VPAELSSSIPSGLTALGHAGPLRPAETPHLLSDLATVTDPRTRAGRRHPLVAILVLAAAAVLAGARSIAAIAEWAADAPQPVRAALGTRRDPLTGHWLWAVPSEPTIRRTLARLDAEALAAAIGAWLADRDRSDRRRRAVAVDGTTLRGASDAQGRQVHLLAAMDHATRAVLAQRQVDGAPGEVPGLRPLLADLDLAGVVVTADALQTHAEAAEFLVAKQAHYLLVVKANQPTLLDRCARLAWHRVPVLDRTRDRGHGRVELRTLKAVTVHHFGFPHAAQVIQVTRKTRELRTRRWRTVTVYAVTSLTFAQASPARLADDLRGHWAIENGLHYLRDTSFAEDGSQVRTGAGPTSWRPRATSPLARCAAPGRSTSPPPCATTPATPPGPWPPSGSLTDDPRPPG
jgi:predicted transposase YbfD/YdcC